MPKPAPPQQASLKEFWNGGKAKAKAKPDEEPVPMEVDSEPPVKAKSASPKPKRKAEEAPVTSDVPAKSTTKKRRVIESDDEDEVAATSANAPSSSKPASDAKPTKQTLLSPLPKRRKKAAAAASDEDDEPAPAPAPKKAAAAKRGKKAVKVVEEKDEDSEPEAARPVADEDGEEEMSSGAEDAEISKAATKNAESALSKVDEVDAHPWAAGKPVPYAALAHTFSLIEATTKRLEKTSLLTAFLMLVIQRSEKDDTRSLLESVYLCINRLCPDYLGIELGIGESLLLKAIAESTGRSLAAIKADLKKEGDLGLVAMNSKNSQKTIFKPKPLTVRSVFKELKEIAMVSGNSSQAKKTGIITKLLAACKDQEAKYIIRSLEGKLRIGNAERSVLISLSHAVVLAEKEKSQKRWSKEKLASRLEEAANVVKQVYSELPSYDEVIPALLEVGIDGLAERCKLTPGVPLKPMLAKPTKAISEVLDRFEGKRFTCEYKYDGERAQVHRLADGSVRVFSRNSEDMSKKYPDLVEQLPNVGVTSSYEAYNVAYRLVQQCFTDKTESFVFDAEAVAVDRTTGKLMPFQELSKRKRKDVKIEDIQVRVCLFAFDLLYLNGEPLLHKSLEDRRELLRQHFKADQRGISLRFPRFIRIRDDKGADEATGPEQIAEMYERQALAQSKGSKKGGGDDDFW
ncbi:hypothetical protein EXIGLDRAFT_697865 [Exidia glandulosa HHB12029]|uniref:DNA ligase n=1 Tax=Exidia glandulosa HHB12029 TaxID=1314781 RepID=A0A165EJK8_EXIGL|nr:hypothetical protein EXIGLDRAFT_697865 [Exidia glandulosa HHB12029]